jgi:Cdc6-like AAA superfamily ATPase
MSNPVIYTWLTSDAPEASRLWLHGNPGTGKSVLAAFLIEQVQMKHDSEDQIVLFYLCKAAGSEKDKAVHVIMAFIRQCIVRRDYDADVATRLTQKLLGEREDYKFTLEEMEPYLSLFLQKYTKIW